MPGDEVPVTAQGLTLYAMWGEATVVAIEVEPNTADVEYNSTLQLTAIVETIGTPSVEVIWSVAGHENATIDNYGLLTVGEVPADTELVVTATSAVNGDIYGTAVITVVEPAVVQILSFDIFNNGQGGSRSRPNVSLANAGLIRMWTQLDGVNRLVPFADLVVTAVDQDGYNAMQFVRVNNMWANPGNVNLIDISQANGAWHTITLTATLNGSFIEVLLVNSLYTPAPAPAPQLQSAPAAPVAPPVAPIAPPVAEEPVVETPIVEEPVVEAPVTAPPQEEGDDYDYEYEYDYVPFLPVT